MSYLSRKIAVVIPVYNSEKTLLHVLNRIPNFVDYLIVVDDCSKDKSYNLIRKSVLNYFRHSVNRGYGGCQKTCYSEVLKSDADIIAMIHPDDQHNPRELENLLKHMIDGNHDLVIGTRFSNLSSPLKNGMPYYKYFGNIFLTKVVNLFLDTKLSDAHSGYRLFKRSLLLSIPFHKNSDNYEFDLQVLVQARNMNYSISNSAVSVNYPKYCSSISFSASLKYTLKTFIDLISFRLHTMHILKSNILTT